MTHIKQQKYLHRL